MCNLCLKDSRCDKVPKGSKKCQFQLANFSSYLFEKQQNECKVHQANKNGSEIEEMKLNKLESVLLKLVIPFIKVVHCPRGKYLKVKGDLILISSDISHSLGKSLPLNQANIPYCFKRKWSYEESYIEEFIEKDKVKMFFSWGCTMHKT